MGYDVDFHGHLVRESARFADAVQQAPPDARVPSCPDWTADDLLWHLGEVQYFWGTVVLEKLDGEDAQKRTPARPGDRAALLEFYQRTSHRLIESLAGASPQTPAWTWSDDQTVGFIVRRQAHEALIHRLDAELTAGARTAIDLQLADDGVDETLRVMYAGVPEWGAFAPELDRTVRVRAEDTGRTWLVTLGRFTGTDPGGKSYDEPDIHIAAADTGAAAAAEIHGAASDLDCWLWHRPAIGPVTRTGDPGVLRGFDEAIKSGID